MTRQKEVLSKRGPVPSAESILPVGRSQEQEFGYGARAPRLVRNLIATTAFAMAMFAAGSSQAAITSNVNAISGKLVVVSDSAGDTIVITRSMANGVQVNGAAPDSGFFSANLILAIEVKADGGDDTIDLSAVDNGTFPNLQSIELNGGGGSDTITGSQLADVINCNGGGDSVDGQGGNDQIFGGNGPDTLHGGNGNDFVGGNEGDDYLDGDAGADTVRGGADNDEMYGSGGDDDMDGNGGQDTLDGGADNDHLNADAINGNEVMNGGTGNDTLDVYLQGAGVMDADGGDGDDEINFETGGSGEHVYVNAGQVSGDGLPTGNYTNMEAVTVDVGPGDDTVEILNTDTTVLGGPGADTFNVAAVGPTGLTLDGEEDCDTYNITFGNLAGPVTVSDSGPDACDVLTVDCQGNALTQTPTSSTSGSLQSGAETIDYSGIETVSFLNCAVPTLTAVATWLMAGLLAVTGFSRLKRKQSDTV